MSDPSMIYKAMTDNPITAGKALITKYFNAEDRQWGLTALVSLFDFHHRQTTRAEDLSRAYLAQMIKVERELAALRGDPGAKLQSAPNTKASEASGRPVSNSETPVSKPKPKLGLDITITL